MSAGRFEPWLGLCRAAAEDISAALAATPSRPERERSSGIGKGGDETAAVDVIAEEIVTRRLEALHAKGHDFVLVSEELGERRFGRNPRQWVVVDPIDGSVNAKRSIPYYSVSVAVADGPTMGDVAFGFVHDFGSGEEWTATSGGGAALNGRPLTAEAPKEPLEILALEATRTDLIAQRVDRLVSLSERLRVLGSLALSLCHLAAGRVDGVCSLREIRSVDVAAAQLLVREQGLAIDLASGGFLQAPLDLGKRSAVVAAGSAATCAQLARAVAT